MRRCAYILIALIFFSMLTSCADNTNAIKNPVTFYYRSESITYGQQASVIQSEIREGKSFAGDAQSAIKQYLNGPQTKGCISPFPAGTTLESFNVDKNRVQITLSPHLAILNGADLMVACACLTQTATDLTGVKTVQIRAEGSLLNGEEVITMRADSFLCIDESPNYLTAAH